MELSGFSTVPARKRVCASALWTCTGSTLPLPYQGALQHLADKARGTLLVKTEAKATLSTSGHSH